MNLNGGRESRREMHLFQIWEWNKLVLAKESGIELKSYNDNRRKREPIYTIENSTNNFIVQMGSEK